MDEAGIDIAPQVEQGVQLDFGLGCAERSPREHGQTQIDDCGIQRIDRLRQIETKRFVDVELARDVDKALPEVCIDALVAYGVGIGQRVACHGAAKPHVIKLGRLTAQARLDVAQAFAISQLRKRHAQILVEAESPRESLRVTSPALG